MGKNNVLEVIKAQSNIIHGLATELQMGDICDLTDLQSEAWKNYRDTLQSFDNVPRETTEIDLITKGESAIGDVPVFVINNEDFVRKSDYAELLAVIKPLEEFKSSTLTAYAGRVAARDTILTRKTSEVIDRINEWFNGR